MTAIPNIHTKPRQAGQSATYPELEQLVDSFEGILKGFGIPIQSGSELEKACLSVREVMHKNRNPYICDPREDIRREFREVLGIWVFLRQVVRLKDHVCFPQFVPHLELLNNGTVVQNTRLPVCQEATNKIFELLFALALLDLSDEVVLDHPSQAKGDNPDVLARIDGQYWGFACKTIYGLSGKTFYDNLKKGVEQIEVAHKAQVGIVVMNFRNIINQDKCWSIKNEAEYRDGEAPSFSAYESPEQCVASHVSEVVAEKHNQVVAEIGLSNIMKLFSGKKALPGYLAYCPTSTGSNTASGLASRSVNMLGVGEFGDIEPY